MSAEDQNPRPSDWGVVKFFSLVSLDWRKYVDSNADH